MARRLGSLGAVLITGAVLLAGSRGGGTPVALALSTVAPRCPVSSLILEYVRQQGAAGSTGWDLALRNAAPATCELQGYPGVGLLDAGARLIGVSVERSRAYRPANVVLRPWQRAYFTLTYATGGAGSACAPHFFSAYGLQVIAPESTQRLLYYSGPFPVCSPGPAVGHPHVYPLRSTLSL